MGRRPPRDDIRAVIEAHLRRLGNDDCAAFVADLWAARGYETRREGTEVIATRDGDSLTISVGAVGDTDGAHITVSVAGDRTDSGTARVIDAGELADCLWYSVDRTDAQTLCERHLGAPPAALSLPLLARLSRRVSVSRLAVFGGVAVLVVLIAVGVGAIPDTADVDTAVVGGDGGATATPTERALPPGVNDSGITDVDALSLAHQRAVGNRSLTIWVDQQRPVFNDGWTIRNYDMDVTTNGQQYRVNVSAGARGEQTTLGTLYHDGDTTYVRVRQNGTSNYQTLSPEQRANSIVPSPAEISFQLVTQYLSTPTTEVVGTVERDGQTLHRVVGRGQPRARTLGVSGNYTATAAITTSGFVRNLTVVYTTDEQSRQFRLSREITYDRVDETVVAVPEWYERRVGNASTRGT